MGAGSVGGSGMNISILGVPMDLGAGRRGVDLGPGALRNAQLAAVLRGLGHTIHDLGDVPVTIPETAGPEMDSTGTAGPQTVDPQQQRGLVFRDSILAACQQAAARLAALPDGSFALSLGGDHSVSMGTVAGASRGERTALLWIDAHADHNTPTSSGSGNIHGMPVAHLTGLGDPGLSGIGAGLWGGGWRVRPEDVVMIGVRSVDPRERELVREAGIQVYTMRDVDQLGITRVTAEALERLQGSSRLHLSFDADALDPSVCPGVGTPVPGGLSYREGHLLMELLADAGRVTSLDIVEVNPTLDVRNRTAQVMVEMAASLLGQRIL